MFDAGTWNDSDGWFASETFELKNNSKNKMGTSPAPVSSGNSFALRASVVGATFGTVFERVTTAVVFAGIELTPETGSETLPPYPSDVGIASGTGAGVCPAGGAVTTASGLAVAALKGAAAGMTGGVGGAAGAVDGDAAGTPGDTFAAPPPHPATTEKSSAANNANTKFFKQVSCNSMSDRRKTLHERHQLHGEVPCAQQRSCTSAAACVLTRHSQIAHRSIFEAEVGGKKMSGTLVRVLLIPASTCGYITLLRRPRRLFR
jgi:hypothetical protein